MSDNRARDNAENRIITWHCDVCDWAITDWQHSLAQVDFHCPRCRRSTLSRFHMKIWDEGEIEVKG